MKCALAIMIALLGSGAALADDDYRRQRAEWRPRGVELSHVHGPGITFDRLKIDDGRYKIRGRDSHGNKVKLKLEPQCLGLVMLGTEFRSDADPSRHLRGTRVWVEGATCLQPTRH